MTRTKLMSGVTIGLGASLLLLSVLPVSGVPMWSRRYGVACTACHEYPSLQLNATGLDFLRRGHRFAGDGFDKDMTHLISAHAEWLYQVQEAQSTAFPSPNFHLHAGGALSPLFSAYVDANVNSDFETSYLQFTTPGETSYFTARGGKISPTLVRNWGNGIMASASTPLIMTDVGIGTNPFTPARGSYGFDVGGRVKNLFLQAGVVNGDDVPGQASVNNHKDVFATVEYNLPDSVSGVALYYYRGGYGLGDQSVAPLLFDRYDRTGVFANYTVDAFRLAGAYLYGKDSIETLPDRKLHGYFVQADVHPIEWGVPFLRYDEVKTQDETGVNKIQKGTLGCSFQVFQNEATAGRLVLEVARQKEAGLSTNSALLDLLWAL